MGRPRKITNTTGQEAVDEFGNSTSDTATTQNIPQTSPSSDDPVDAGIEAFNIENNKNSGEATKERSEIVPQATSEIDATPHQDVVFNRDDRGLIRGVDYKYKADGRIDWEAMFDPEFYIYPDHDPARTPLLKVDGLRELAEIRGVESKHVEFQQTMPDMVICKVKFKYIPNFEDPKGREWSAIADASGANIGSGFAKYLATMAETRATGRCHREALGIRLCTFEEVCPDDLKSTEDRGAINDATMAAIHKQMEIKRVTNDELIAKIQEKLPNIKAISELNQTQGAVLLGWLNSKQNAKTKE